MKVITAVSLSLLFLVSLPFAVSAGSASGSALGQVVTKTKRTTRHVSHKTKVTTKKVSHKTWHGTKRVAHTTRVKTRPARRTTWRTGRKVVSRTKKIFN